MYLSNIKKIESFFNLYKVYIDIYTGFIKITECLRKYMNYLLHFYFMLFLMFHFINGFPIYLMLFIIICLKRYRIDYFKVYFSHILSGILSLFYDLFYISFTVYLMMYCIMHFIIFIIL